MREDILLIDVGNSRIKWLRAREGEIDPASAGQGDLEDFDRAMAAYPEPPAAEVRIASVAAEERALAVGRICRRAGIGTVSRLQTRDGQGDVRCGYTEPGRLGVDRWLALVGAVAHHGAPVVAWDLGTATTLDAADASRQHLGGWILPGPGTMLRSLGSHTQLPLPGEQPDPEITRPGTETSGAIRRGILAAQLGALDRFLAEVGQRCGEAPKVVVTGGAAAAILIFATDRELVHDPWLVFRGMLVE